MSRPTRQPPPEPPERPIIRLKPNTYQPSKAELDEPVQFDATPEEALRALVTPVTIIRDSK